MQASPTLALTPAQLAYLVTIANRANRAVFGTFVGHEEREVARELEALGFIAVDESPAGVFAHMRQAGREAARTPVVGGGATIGGWSECYAATVTDVSPSGKRATIQEDKATLLNGAHSGEPDALKFSPGGFAGHTSGTQRWVTEPNPEGAIHKISLRKDGTWRVANSDRIVTVNVRAHHYDFNF